MMMMMLIDVDVDANAEDVDDDDDSDDDNDNDVVGSWFVVNRDVTFEMEERGSSMYGEI